MKIMKIPYIGMCEACDNISTQTDSIRKDD